MVYTLYPTVYYLNGEISRIGVAPNMEANASAFRQLCAQGNVLD